MSTTTTPNMGLILPGVGTESGPDYAEEINSALTVIDSHDHSAGNGTPITSSALSITGDLNFNNFSATTLKSIRLSSQSSNLSDLGCVYNKSGDLWYNNSSGDQVQLTTGSSIVGTTGSISGLASPASATYSSGTTTFAWQSNTNTPAIMDMGPILLRNLNLNSPYVALSPPTSAFTTSYQLYFPTAKPSSGTKIVTVDSAGLISFNYDVDNSTLTIASNLIKVANQGITRTQLAAVGQQLSASSGNANNATPSLTADIPNATVTLTTTGRPVFIAIQPDGTSALSNLGSSGASGGGCSGEFILMRDGVAIAYWNIGITAIGANSTQHLFSGLTFLDTGASAGAHTWKFQYRFTAGNNVMSFYMKTVAYEL